MSLVLKNCNLLDGTGGPSKKCDILIRGDKIAALGSFPENSAQKVIDADGAYVAPGFIDAYNDADRYMILLREPQMDYALRQGITTIIGGASGVSLAPLLYGGSDSLRHLADVKGVNVDWQNMSDFMKSIARIKLGCNFATFAGVRTIAYEIAGSFRDLTDNEKKVASRLAGQAVEEGAVGVSFGPLSSLAGSPFWDLPEDSVFAVDVPISLKLAKDMRDKKLMLCRGLVEANKYGEDAILQSIGEAGSNARFTVHPFGYSVKELRLLLPANLVGEPTEVVCAKLADDWSKKRIVADLPDLDPLSTYIASAPDHDYLVGMSLSAFMDSRGASSAKNGLAEFMLEVGMRGSVLAHSYDMNMVKRLCDHPQSLVTSSFADYLFCRAKSPVKEETASFPAFLSRSMRKGGLSSAVKKITWDVARYFNLDKAGIGKVAPGMRADLVVFWGSEIKHVIVAGEIALEAGNISSKRLGRPIINK